MQVISQNTLTKDLFPFDLKNAFYLEYNTNPPTQDRTFEPKTTHAERFKPKSRKIVTKK